MNTVSELISSAAAGGAKPNALQICAAGAGARVEEAYERLEYSKLFADALTQAQTLRDAGMEPGDYCLVTCTSVRTTLTAFFACIAAGAVPAVQPEAPALRGAVPLAARLGHWRERLGPGTWIAMDPEQFADVSPHLADLRRVLRLEPPSPASESPPPVMHRADPDDTAFVQITSGTTGLGNAVAVSHRNIFAEVAELADRLQWEPHSVLSSWAPLYHDMGLVGGALGPVVLNVTGLIFRPSVFLMSPATWLRSIAAFGVTVRRQIKWDMRTDSVTEALAPVC